MVIWFDVTAVMRWRRPPSGMVRTEIELARELFRHRPGSTLYIPQRRIRAGSSPDV